MYGTRIEAIYISLLGATCPSFCEKPWSGIYKYMRKDDLEKKKAPF